MDFAGGMCVFPGGGVDPRDFDTPSPGPARRRPSGRRGSAATRRRPGRWCAPPSARPSRSPACCWPARRRRRSSPTPPADDWEADRVALESRELSLTDFLDRRGLVLRTDLLGVWDALADPGLRADALPHLVLRGPAAGGPGHPRRLDRVVVGRRGCPAMAAVEQADAGEHGDDAARPTSPALEVGAVRQPRRGARRGGRRARWRCSRPTVEPLGDGFDAVDARRGCGRWSPGGDAGVSAGRAAASASAAVRAGAQRRDDDARRHQHLGAARARCARGRSWSTPGRSRPAHLDAVRAESRRGRPWCC